MTVGSRSILPTCVPLAVLALALTSAQPIQSEGFALQVENLATPAAGQSSAPYLSASPKGVILSWIERTGDTAVLRFSELNGDAWTSPRNVASGTNWFVNWADVPSVVRLSNGTLTAHWLQKSGSDTYAYDVRLSYSNDDGKTWRQSFVPHVDGTQTEHGFVSLFDAPGGGLALVWLDGRAMTVGHDGHEGSGDMSLRFAAYDGKWKQVAEAALDSRVCECCPTAMAMTTDGPLVAYRDRSDNEVRDIHVTRLENGKWTAPVAVHNDEWRVPACPVNGPALSARGREVAVAWFMAKNDQPKSFVAFSSDAGRTFGAPVRLDDEASLGRVDVELLPAGAAAASYVEFAKQRASFRVRRIARDGTRSVPVTIAGLTGNRTSGLPRMISHRNRLVFAWVDREGTSSQVRTARATIR
jgi:hypothetical protein